MKSHIVTVFHGVKDGEGFIGGIQKAVNEIPPFGVFAGDNLFTFGRNLSFLDDTDFMASFTKNISNNIEKSIIWRIYVLSWAAKRGLGLEGDFVECGCYKGTTARIIADYLDFGNVDKKFYLYDLFEHTEGMKHHAMAEHGADLYGRVRDRFSDLDNVQVIKGAVPDSFSQGMPERISFLHIDMNNASAEIGALDHLFDRVATGAVIVFDDYGWIGYRDQKQAEDRFFAERGSQVLELPTGQGLVIK
jgi:hypothetical protein